MSAWLGLLARVCDPGRPLVSLRSALVSGAALAAAGAALLLPGPSRAAAAAIVQAHHVPGLC
jgi:uncharacterized membrane protein